MTAYQFCTDVMGLQDTAAVRRLVPFIQRKSLPRGTLLLREGDPIRELFMLEEGCVVAGTLEESGDYRVDCIETTPGTVCVGANFYENPLCSTLTIRTGTNSVFFVMRMDRLLKAMESEPAVARLYVEVLEKSLHRNWCVRRALTGGSAMDRYQWFLSEYPGLDDQLPDRAIASYLNMSPITLSRMRNAAQNPEK